jgi:hypothetical protein
MVMASCAIYILRKRPGEQPGFPAPGYPVVPAFYIVVSLYIILVTSVSSPASIFISGTFAVFGWLIYRIRFSKNTIC